MKIEYISPNDFDQTFYYLDIILNNFIRTKISQLDVNKIFPKYHQLI